MNEQQWLSSDDPDRLVYHLVGGSAGLDGDRSAFRVSARKLRLVACAFGRQKRRLIDESREAIVAAERFADGEMDSEGRGRAYNRTDPLRGPQGTIARAVLRSNPAIGLSDFVSQPTDDAGEQHAGWCAIIRDVAGNPFSPVATKRPLPWLVVNLAESAYGDRLDDGKLDPARLAVLSDAVEELAMYVPERLLEHLRRPPTCDACQSTGQGVDEYAGTVIIPGGCPRCRGHVGPHYRGCWAIDLLLGKE